MESTIFFNDQSFQEFGAATYNKNMEPTPYRHTLYRPAGGMNSSAKDMASLVLFLLQRGLADSLRLISNESISRMETPGPATGAGAGLELGFGLGNSTSIYGDFIYYGHSGMTDGGLTELAYLPEYGAGHVFFINASNGHAFSRISNLLRDFEIHHIRKRQRVQEIDYTGNIKIRAGYYVPVNPRNQAGLFLDYVFGVEKIKVADSRVTKAWIFPGPVETYIPVTDSTFLRGQTGKIGLVRTMDPLTGEVLHFDKLVMKRIPGSFVFLMLSSVAAWLIFSLMVAITWMVFFIRSLKTGFPKTLLLLSYANLTSLLFAIILLLTLAGYKNPDVLLARPTPLSVSLLIFSVLIPVSVIFSFIKIFRYRNLNIKNHLYLPVVFLSMLQAFVCTYLIWFGVIPVITWK
jgi:hypothetical protein